jgi:hypothetical protein
MLSVTAYASSHSPGFVILPCVLSAREEEAVERHSVVWAARNGQVLSGQGSGHGG